MAGYGREREKRYFCGKCGIKGILENRNTLACGGRKWIKGKGKRKRNDKEKIFPLGLKMKLLNRQIPGLKSKMWKSFRKMPESSEIRVFRNDSK